MRQVPFDWDEATGTATLRIALPLQEVAILNAECYAPGDALDYWWKNSAEQWHELKQPTRDFSKYTQGEWRDPTQDLKEGWDVLAAKERKVSAPSAPLREIPLDCLQFWGWPEGQGALCRKTFDLADPAWAAPVIAAGSRPSFGGEAVILHSAEGGTSLPQAATRLVLGAWVGPNFLSPATIRLNGETLAEKTTVRYVDCDVTALLKPTGNVLEVEFADAREGEKFTGMNGSIYLYRREAPSASVWAKGEELDAGHETVDANGDKKTTDASNVSRLTPRESLRAAVVLCGKPGVGDAIELFVPAEWQGRYRVRLYMEGTRDVPKGVRVRDRFMRKHHHNFGNITDIDITDLLRFGETNRIDLGANSPNEAPDKTSAKFLDVIRLDLYPETRERP